MDKKEIAALVLSSAVIGALFSAAITAFAQWRERVARQKELVLKVSVEMTTAYIERIASVSKDLGILPEFPLLPLIHQMVQELFEDGAVSDKNMQELKKFTNIAKQHVDSQK